MIPGELILKDEDVVCNAGKKTVTITVKNTGDRPIQVGSHYHFFEVNKALDFDRGLTFGMRLNIPSSTAVRFEPGQQKQVVLVEIGGKKLVYGHNGLTNGSVAAPGAKEKAMSQATAQGYKGAR